MSTNIPFQPPGSRNDFEIAIVCALPLEADAVIAVFDDYWDDDDHELRPSLMEDQNEYTFGRIGRHNVIVLVLPHAGKIEASSAVAAMRPSFRNIQLCLVVGVCGVAPKTQHGSEILLGDVIISTYVIQSDFGRQYEDAFVRKDTPEDNLPRPSSMIRSLLNWLHIDCHHEKLEGRMRSFARELRSRKPLYAYPGKEHDRLYNPGYVHMHRGNSACRKCKEVKHSVLRTCEHARSASCQDVGCETSQLVPRERHSATLEGQIDASIWFGPFASGDQFVKSSAHREQLHCRDQVIAFDMEGGGAWETFPTLIIKSGSNYADSHESRGWKNHCAGNAAACAKALLREWRKKDN